jgi:hypothetical protein
MPKRSSIDREFITLPRHPIEGKGEGLYNDAPRKNPAAVALGRLGGIKGGKARAEKLSKEERHRIAVLAAQSRWHGK